MKTGPCQTRQPDYEHLNTTISLEILYLVIFLDVVCND